MKLIKQMFRKRPPAYLCINGVFVPEDRHQWTDDMEREIMKMRSRML